MQPKYGHQDATYRPPEHGRDAFSAQRLGLSEQSTEGVAKLAQGTGPRAACEVIGCQGGQHDRGLTFQ